MDIINFEQLIGSTLKQGEKYISHECERLLATGENYGSVMLKVQIKILTDKNEEEILHYVGKACPPTDYLWEIFNTKVTFKTETAVYSKIVPTLNEYGKEKGIDTLIDFVAKYIGSRISLDSKSDIVDKDCLLLLENIKTIGYDIGNRFIGFDLETTKLILRDLAIFHAVPIAFRFEKPDEFMKQIQVYLKKTDKIPKDNAVDPFIERISNALKPNPECLPYLAKVEKHLRNFIPNRMNPLKLNELYATLVHNDYWVNNTMIKFENGKPVSNKMVDFQVVSYNSLAQDVIFFLYTSVDLSVLEKQVDDLMKFYYDQFIGTLSRLNFDTSKYSYDDMLKEFARITNHVEFGHALGILFPMMTLRGEAKELSELGVDDTIVQEESLHENFYKRMQFIVLDIGRRGWI